MTDSLQASPADDRIVTTIKIGKPSLALSDVVAVARGGSEVSIAAESLDAIETTRRWTESVAHGRDQTVYGVNTGFGPLARTAVAAGDTERLSANVVLACISSVGPLMPEEFVRAMMVLRAHALAQGHSGVRRELIETLCKMLNRGVTPVVRSKGSLGASGDLAPLASVAVVFVENGTPTRPDYSGRATYRGEEMSGTEAMAGAQIERLRLGPKEGLALTNGMSFMQAAGAMGLTDAWSSLLAAEVAASLSFEAMVGMSEALDPRIHEVSQQLGNAATARNLRRLTAGSSFLDSDATKVQDAYSLRCTPQVLGPIRDTLEFLEVMFSRSINAVADNPIVFASSPEEGEALSGGNFHGQGPALWLDTLGISITEIASMAERRVFRLLTPELSDGLPSMLVAQPGLNSGLMMAQYTAAALVSDSKTLAHPDSVDSLPSSGNQEDHVSMGANAGRHALEIVENLRQVVAIELLVACQAIDLRGGPGGLGAGTSAAYHLVRSVVETLHEDRALEDDIWALADLVRDVSLVSAVESAIGVTLR